MWKGINLLKTIDFSICTLTPYRIKIGARVAV
jgi:hypothetical protein